MNDTRVPQTHAHNHIRGEEIPMADTLLAVRGLSAAAGEKAILHDIDLEVEKGAIHVLMGPNGAGKSTLGHVLMGNPAFTVTGGTIELEGEDITELDVDKRSRAGLFISFQAPVEVPGVPLNSFLRAIVAQHDNLNLKGKKYKKRVAQIMEQLDMDERYLDRELNVGFSGGEKKKIEMLQLLLLQPKLAILDETDSGLDVDALNVVSKAMAAYREECDGTILIITHNTRILEHLPVDHTHVLVKGRLVAEGDAGLIAKIDEEGFEQFGHVEGEGDEQSASEGAATPAFNVEDALADMEEALAAADAAAAEKAGE